MARQFWKGAISFGLVNIPVKMSVAAESTTSPGFHYLHKKCLTRPFKPQSYHDEYRDALETMIEAKIQGKEIAVAEAPAAKVPDLMSALKASIEAAKRTKEKTESKK